MDLQGPDSSDSKDSIFSHSKEPMIINSDSRDSIFNSYRNSIFISGP